MLFGFLNINKPVGLTSHDVIGRLRRILNIKKIGHAGTLDPGAEGVLPVAVGYATKLIDYLPAKKEYVGSFKLGYVSDSYDTELKLQKFSDKKETSDEVLQILKYFRGEIRQKPPIYSAIKVNGKKLYEIARKGETTEIPERTITVDQIELKSFDEQRQTGDLLISCSKGTYIRSIIHDIGQKLDTGAVMSGLIRTKSGGMSIENSIKLEDLTTENVTNYLMSPDEILDFQTIFISEIQFSKVRNGNGFALQNTNGLTFLKFDERIIALAEISDNFVKVLKVFL